MRNERDGPRTLIVGLACALFLVGTVACASSPRDPDVPRGPSDLIPTEEVAYYRDQGVPNAFSLIERARPQWFRSAMGSPTVSSGRPRTVVFLDNHMLESFAALRNIHLVNVLRAEWLTAAQADMLPRAGNMNLQGAIVVHTVR